MAGSEIEHINFEAKPAVERQSAKPTDGSKATSSSSSGVFHVDQTSPNTGFSNSNATNQFEKPHRTFSKGKDIRETPKYHDVESYVNQRHHYIGTGVFNADNIDDLPPRYRTKVLNAYEWLAATFPQANMTASDLIALETNNSLKKHPNQPPLGYQNFRGQPGNHRENHNQPSFSNGVHMSNDQESSNHASYTNQNHLGRNNSFRDNSRPGPSNFTSRDSSTSSKDSHQEKRTNKSHNQEASFPEPQSLGMSSSETSNEPPKKYPNAKSFPQHKKSNEPSRCESSDLSKGQSVHFNEKFPPAPEFDRNIPNRHSKPSFRDAGHTRNRQPDSESSTASDINRHSKQSYRDAGHTRNRQSDSESSTASDINRHSKQSFRDAGHTRNRQSDSESSTASDINRHSKQSHRDAGHTRNRQSDSESSTASDINRHSKQSFRDAGHTRIQQPDSESSVASDINRRSKQSFRDAGHTRNLQTDSVSSTASEIKPNKDGNRSWNNYLKNSQDTYSKCKNFLSADDDSRLRSDDSYENNRNRTNSETSSTASDKRFHNNKRNQKSSISSQSSNTFKSADNEQSCEISTDASKRRVDSIDTSSAFKKGGKYQNINVSDGRNVNVANPSLQSPSKKRKSNRRNKNHVAELENGPMVKTPPSLPKSSYDSSRAFSNKDQCKQTGNEKNSPIEMDEHMKRVIDLINQKQNHHIVNHTTIAKTDQNSKFSQNEKYDNKSTDTNNSRYSDKNSSKFLDSKSEKGNVQCGTNHRRPNSQNSVSPEKMRTNRTNGSGKSHTRRNSQNSVSSEKMQADRTCDGGSKSHSRQNSQNSVSSGKMLANRTCDFGGKSPSRPISQNSVLYEKMHDNRTCDGGSKSHSRPISQDSVSSEKIRANRTCDGVFLSYPNISNGRSNANCDRTNSTLSRESFSRSDSRSSSSSKFNNSRNFEDKSQVDRVDSSRVAGNQGHTRNTLVNSSEFTPSAVAEKQNNCKEQRLGSAGNKSEEMGFFVSVSVSDSLNKEMDWHSYFANALKHKKFDLDPCCKFTESLILSFEEKCHAIEAISCLRKLKQRKIVPGQPHLILVGNLKYHRVRPCNCQNNMVYSCLVYFKEFSEKYIQEHQSKMVDVENELHALDGGKKTKFWAEQRKVLQESLRMLEDMERVFQIYINNLKNNLQSAPANYFYICKLKSNFMRECQSFQRCLPIYSRKDDILELLGKHSVTVISAETGSGKSTQLAEYLLQSWVADRGTIICTQPRKIAAISITNYVCGKIGSAVGKLIGYDVGTEKKYDKDTKIIYMTDYALLRKFKRNPLLKGISCVIIDEAHERTLHTDLLLGMIKECLGAEMSQKPELVRHDLRVVITSATIDPSVFVRYFDFLTTAVIDVPGRVYPVEVVWLKEDVDIGWNYLKKCVQTAVEIHTEQPEGDILVFLVSPSEIDEAILMFKDMYSRPQMPMLMSLHGKSDLQEQMRIFEVTPPNTRKIIFATNAAETSLTIPGIRYVIDCGMVKEMMFFPKKNKNCLIVTFINKSSAEQRKGRAGRTQPGICYRMYSERNYKEMPDRASPEILRTSLQSALLKIYELGFKPDRFDFVESPSKESIAKSLESLELLNLIKDECLTDLGKKVVELPIEPRLAKLVLQGLALGVGYEMTIIAAMVREAGRLFVRADEIKVLADQKKIGFCQETGDLCTYLEVYKRWREVAQSERHAWCVENFISSKALNSAEKTIKDIVVSLHMDLGILLVRRYNNAAFNSKFEKIVFNCFSENLCMYSGHPKVGYFSFILNDSLYIHPSSSVYYLGKDLPQFLVYSTLMQTSQNFLMDVTPIKENVVNKSYQKGAFKMSADVLKSLKIVPKTLGPFGDIVLRNHIIGKGGSKIVNIEVMIEKLTNSKNFKIDIIREKGSIIIYSEERFHEKISQHINESVKEAHNYLSKEEDIFKMTGFIYLCIGSGGIVNDIVMPGEFREIIVENLSEFQVKDVENALRECGNLKIIKTTNTRKTRYKNFQITATFTKVADALQAKKNLSQKNLNVKSTNFVQESNEKETPIYRIQVSWSRAISEGVGWVEFDSEADCIGASSSLTSSSFFIGPNYIRFTPSSSSVKQLDMRNLPLIIDEDTIEKNLVKVLSSLIKPKTIYIKRKKLPAATNADVLQMQNKLSSQFRKFTPPNQMIVNVNCPAYGDPMWQAVVYFENSVDGENAFKELNGKLCIDSVLVQLNAIRKSHLFCKSQVVRAVKSEIEQLRKEFSTTTFSFNKVQNDTMVDVGYSCKSMEDLTAVQQKLSKLFQGCTIQCQGNAKFSHLFTVRGHQLIAEIQNSTKTLITLDDIRKVISIHGPKNNCAKAQVDIYLLVEKEVSSKRKVFNLKNSSMPTGFLKCLYIKYGINLQGLICDFSLKAAVLNAVKGTLTIEGSSANLRKVEEHLESICTELYNKHQTVKLEDGKEACDICLDPLSIDFHRLENCGHAFCKECLLLQVESKTVPLVCVKQDCGKDFFIVDIKTLLSRVEDLQKNFYGAALQHHISCNIGKLSYCPIPDCYMVYRVSVSEGKHQCAGCQNIICTHCHTPFHYGMSCDMFKKCTEDEDYSLKVWMAENSHLRKQCPKCKVVIEKNDGCNHMECINCHSHMCWLCLELFPDDRGVYNHLPYCPSNQNR